MTWTAPAWTRAIAGPATHAFVIGVSSYPDAKPGKGFEPALRAVPDIASADASAMLVADWLYRNRDELAAPLASLDILHGSSSPPAGREQYALHHLPPPAAMEPADSANVKAAGKAWLKRLREQDGNVAFFFICGHGAVRNDQHVVFLSDLNSDEEDPWGAFLNLFKLGRILKHEPKIGAGMLYADSCQEFIPAFELEDVGKGVVLARTPKKIAGGKDNVLLLSAAPSAYKAYEGEWRGNDKIRVGRFTETLVDALGTSVRFRHQDARWVVHSHSVLEDLKMLHRIRRPDWASIEFSPSPGLMPGEALPIATIASPKVPVAVQADPFEKMASCAFNIYVDSQRTPPPCASRETGNGNIWVPEVTASMAAYLLEAKIGAAVTEVAIYPQCPIIAPLVKVS